MSSIICAEGIFGYNMKRINLSEPSLDQLEEEALLNVLTSGWLTQGPKVKQFEEEFSEFIGRPSLAVSSCTAALHLAHLICGAKTGLEVIVPSLTFVATPNTVRYTGADVVFADIKSIDDWTIDPESVASKISEQTVGITVMHYAGYGSDMKKFADISKSFGLYLVEDACHGLGGSFEGRALGTFGDISCFSFYGNKVMTTGEGGMMVFQNPELVEIASSLRSHGMTNLAWDRVLGALSYNVSALGYNYRMDDLRASIGIAQLSKLKSFIKSRQKLVEIYKREIAQIDEIHVPTFGQKLESANYIFPLLLKSGDRDAFREKLDSKGVQTSVHYTPCHQFESYNTGNHSLPVTDYVGAKCFSLPLFSSMRESDVDFVCQTLQDCARLSL